MVLETKTSTIGCRKKRPLVSCNFGTAQTTHAASALPPTSASDQRTGELTVDGQGHDDQVFRGKATTNSNNNV